MRKVPKVITNSLNNSINLSYKKQNCSLIWLHGLGDTSQGFMSFFTHSSSPLYQGVRIKLIQAPLRNVTINGGQKCHSWYDIRSLKRFTQEESKVFDFQQMQESRKIIQNHIQQEIKFWQEEEKNSQINPYHRIYIGGFSQGGVMALNYGLQAKNIPAGVISLSGYLLKSTPLTNYKKIPICIMHGQNDQIIKQVEAKHSYEKILGESPIIQYNCLKNLGHTVRLQQLTMFKNWFKECNQMISVHYKKK